MAALAEVAAGVGCLELVFNAHELVVPGFAKECPENKLQDKLICSYIYMYIDTNSFRRKQGS